MARWSPLDTLLMHDILVYSFNHPSLNLVGDCYQMGMCVCARFRLGQWLGSACNKTYESYGWCMWWKMCISQMAPSKLLYISYSTMPINTHLCNPFVTHNFLFSSSSFHIQLSLFALSCFIFITKVLAAYWDWDCMWTSCPTTPHLILGGCLLMHFHWYCFG